MTEDDDGHPQPRADAGDSARHAATAARGEGLSPIRLLGTPDDRLRGVDQDDALDRRLCEAYGLTNDEYTDLISLNDDSPFLQRHEIVTHYLDLLIRKRQATEYQP